MSSLKTLLYTGTCQVLISYPIPNSFSRLLSELALLKMCLFYDKSTKTTMHGLGKGYEIGILETNPYPGGGVLSTNDYTGTGTRTCRNHIAFSGIWYTNEPFFHGQIWYTDGSLFQHFESFASFQGFRYINGSTFLGKLVY
jgi:hypothetical protein